MNANYLIIITCVACDEPKHLDCSRIETLVEFGRLQISDGVTGNFRHFPEQGMSSSGKLGRNHRLSLKIPLGTRLSHHYKPVLNGLCRLSIAGTMNRTWHVSTVRFHRRFQNQTIQFASHRTVTFLSFARLMLL